VYGQSVQSGDKDLSAFGREASWVGSFESVAVAEVDRGLVDGAFVAIIKKLGFYLKTFGS